MKKLKSQRQLYKKTCFLLILFLVIISAVGCNDLKNNNSKEEKTEVQLNKEEEKEKESLDSDIPTEYKTALKKAKLYNDNMNMSKASLYNQLISEYGEKFSVEAAQYAIDNIHADWKANALKKAKIYQDTMSMSTKSIYDQLTSEYGERFTNEEAQYAVDNLK